MFCKTGAPQTGQRTSKNLYKSLFIVKNEGWTNNEVHHICFVFIELFSWMLPLVEIFEACFPPVRITNSYSVKIISKCSDVATTNQASAMELFCENT